MAWLFGLEHPQWSAMTVWAASQPTRGQLLEKSLFRVAGTISGTVAGVLLMVLSGGQPIILAGGLAVWIALCAGIGNLQRGFIAYGTMLAGYSASMVALLDTAHPDHVLALGADRLATILVGVLVALVIGLLFTLRTAEEALTGRLRRLTARVLHDLADGLGHAGDGSLAAEQHDILAEMAAIEEALEPHGAGSLRSRRSVRSIRTLLMAEISLLLLARRPRMEGDRRALIAALQEEAALLEAGAAWPEILVGFDRIARLSASDRSLHEPLSSMAAVLRDYASPKPREAGVEPSVLPVVLHRDWAGAWRALVRAGIMMLAVGLFWIVTGWSGGPFLLLGVSIMTSLFSTFDNPSRMMRMVVIGQIFGALGALACRFLVWPLASSELEVILLTMPFILVSGLFFSYSKTVLTAFDYAMVSLLLLHPVYPPTGTFMEMLAGAFAVVAAPVIAMAAYRFVFPLDTKSRFQMLGDMMIHEVQRMARATDLTSHRLVWRARLYHRLLRLSHLADRGGGDRAAAIDGGLAVLAVGSAILALGDLAKRSDVPNGVGRALRVALGRVARIADDPSRTAAALYATAAKVATFDARAAETVASGGRALAVNETFFRRTP